MDSDEDSDSSHSVIKSYSRYSYEPYLRLYDKDEVEAREQAAWKRRDTGDPVWDEFPKIFRTVRFFKTYEGFYTGSLDLTGRHMPRYTSLHNRWNSYLPELLSLAIHTREVTIESTNSPERPQPQQEYVFSDVTIWDNFREKWRIPPIVDFAQLLFHTFNVLSTIKDHPAPCIQRLCLVDLPAELLDAIFQSTDMNEARALSSTSRKLNEVGRRYIFGSRTLSFELPMSFWGDIAGLEDPQPYLMGLAGSEREKVLEKAEFLLSRPDLCQQMKQISLLNNWCSHSFEGTDAEGFEISQIEPEFFAPIHQRFMSILAVSTNLVAVTFFSLPFSTHVARHFSGLRALHTLTVQDCLVTGNFLSGSELDGIELLVYNLCLRFTPETTNMWDILLLCPNLRTLAIISPLISPLGFDIPVPSIELWTRCRFFPHLERLTLTHICSRSLNDLAFALLAGAVISGLHITHFKLHTRCGVRDAEILFLLHAIQYAPIEVLVLEGLAEAEPVLFSRIGEYFESTLVALTLIRRASDRQVRNREITWPHPTWQYAPHLSRLTKLQHFGWNSFCPFTVIPSSSLLYFEDGFPENPYRYGREDSDNGDAFGLDALPFAVHCPNLETYTGYFTFSSILISRTNTGSVHAKPLDLAGPVVQAKYDIYQWNPPTLVGSKWPHIIPVGVDTKTGNS